MSTSVFELTADMVKEIVESPDRKTMTAIYSNGMKEILSVEAGVELSRVLNERKKKMQEFERVNGVRRPTEQLAAHRGTGYKGPIRQK